MMTKKEIKKLTKIKTNAIILKRNYQIPSLLYSTIMGITENTPLETIELIKNASDDLIRVKGYYNDNKRDEKGNNELLDLLGKWFVNLL